METGNRTDDLNIPPALVAQVRAAANEDHRPASDMLRDAIERYLDDRRWRRTYEYGEERARRLGLTEKDVPRIIAENRARHRHGPEC